MKSFVPLMCILVVLLGLSGFGQEHISGSIGLNKDIFYPPDRMEIWVRGANPGLETPVDVYLSVTTPEGKELFGPDFTEMAL